MTGWKCPGCGTCYAPFVTQCSCCKPMVAITTSPYTWPLGTGRPLPRPPENIC